MSLSDLLHLVRSSLGPSMLLQMALFHPIYGWVIFIVCMCIYIPYYMYIIWYHMWYIYHIFFINSSVDRHLGGICVLIIEDSAAMNSGVQLSFWIRVYFDIDMACTCKWWKGRQDKEHVCVWGVVAVGGEKQEAMNEQGCMLECALYLPGHQFHLFQQNSLLPYSWSSTIEFNNGRRKARKFFRAQTSLKSSLYEQRMKYWTPGILF